MTRTVAPRLWRVTFACGCALTVRDHTASMAVELASVYGSGLCAGDTRRHAPQMAVPATPSTRRYAVAG